MRWLLYLALAMLPVGCGAPTQKRRPAPRDPTIRTLDRLLSKGGGEAQAPSGEAMRRCLQRAALEHPCEVKKETTLKVRVALDPRYTTKWADWEERLARTFACVNTLYSGTGLQWDVEEIEPWPPGAQRHDLYSLLSRLQRERPFDGKSLALGITVWDERRVFASAGGEIGLSQRASCVVPSWPRVENDCVILAHELGHLVGARHVPGKKWIMGWAARPFHLPARDPIARVVATYRFHPRNRDAISMYRRASYTRGGLRLPAECQARLRAIDRCWKL